MKNILVTGGAGYVGAVLVPYFLGLGYKVTVLDLMIYGRDVLPSHENLNVVEGDIRDGSLLKRLIPGHDCIIHLACISNDPSFELNPQLGKSINFDAFRPLVEHSKAAGAARFIYASSSSVYGIKTEADVHEGMSLEPLTDYSSYKAACESVLAEYQSSDFSTVSIRPATVCGYSRRQRLDVVVNILTNLAYNTRKISVYGGDQLRPNIHIADMAKAYRMLVEADDGEVSGKVFNAGYENQPVREMAKIVKTVVGDDVEIIETESDDKRSYHISSKKIRDEVGFEATHTIAQAVEDLCAAFQGGKLPESLHNNRYFNIKRMQSVNLS